MQCSSQVFERGTLFVTTNKGHTKSRIERTGLVRLDSGTSQGEVPGSQATNHLRQRAAVHRSRLQGVHSNLRYDACADFNLLSPIERENRALAQVAKERVHPTGNTAFAGRWAAPRQGYVEHYNNIRLNSAIGYITPKDMLGGRQREIHAERDRKLQAARKQRQIRRQQAA